MQFRRSTAADLAAVDEVPLSGEIVIETDTGKFKFGDGVQKYSELNYSGAKLPNDDSKYVVQNGDYVKADYVENKDVEYETWTITLENDSVITRKVVLWTSQE